MAQIVVSVHQLNHQEKLLTCSTRENLSFDFHQFTSFCTQDSPLFRTLDSMVDTVYFIQLTNIPLESHKESSI